MGASYSLVTPPCCAATACGHSRLLWACFGLAHPCPFFVPHRVLFALWLEHTLAPILACATICVTDSDCAKGGLEGIDRSWSVLEGGPTAGRGFDTFVVHKVYRRLQALVS